MRTATQRSSAETLPDRRERERVPEAGEFAMTQADFDQVRSQIYQRAGITLAQGKRAMVYSRLSRRLRETGQRSFAGYLQRLASLTGEAGAAEWQEFVNCLTTNLTAFFREPHHFPLLADALKARRGAASRIWCNAASTGEEPYSIAIAVRETLGDNAQVKIVASDIDTRVLEIARRGVYEFDPKGLDDARLRRHFQRGSGANEGMMRVQPELARTIEFRPFNLMNERWSLGAPFDVVFCRNVMIYFDSATQRRVLERMHRAMNPGALLFAGHSENFADARELFRLRGKTVYERV